MLPRRWPALRATVAAAAGQRSRIAGSTRVRSQAPVKPRLVVHRILLPGETLARGIVGELGAIDFEQRAGVPALAQPRARGHCRETGNPGPAQQLDQHRFELVIAMMGGQQPLARRELALERRIARLSRGGFDAFSSRRFKSELEDSEGDSEFAGRRAGSAPPHRPSPAAARDPRARPATRCRPLYRAPPTRAAGRLNRGHRNSRRRNLRSAIPDRWPQVNSRGAPRRMASQAPP